MPVKYKINVVQALKDKGYSSYRLRRDKIIGERQIQQLRTGDIVSLSCIDKICSLLDCQPGDILEHIS